MENEHPRMNAAIPERKPATEEISHLIERVTFHNGESGFCVLRVKARRQREETTVVPSKIVFTMLLAGGNGVYTWCRFRDQEGNSG